MDMCYCFVLVTVCRLPVNSNLYCVMVGSTYLISWQSQGLPGIRACLKNHSCNLHAPLCGRFCPHLVDVACYAALIQAKSPTNCDVHLTESIFKTHSSRMEIFLELKGL